MYPAAIMLSNIIHDLLVKTLVYIQHSHCEDPFASQPLKYKSGCVGAMSGLTVTQHFALQ